MNPLVEKMLDGLIDAHRPGTLDSERPALRLMMRSYGKLLVDVMIEMKNRGLDPFKTPLGG